MLLNSVGISKSLDLMSMKSQIAMLFNVDVIKEYPARKLVFSVVLAAACYPLFCIVHGFEFEIRGGQRLNSKGYHAKVRKTITEQVNPRKRRRCK